MTNREVVTQFLTAYQRHDAPAMEARLDPRVEFADMAFPSIRADEVRAMWRWFCRSSEDRPQPVEVPGFDIVEESGDRVLAEYWVRYDVKGRRVNYVIRSEFTVRAGKIARQVDRPTISKFEVARMATGFRLAALAMPWAMARKLKAQPGN